jgi:hypothetical protein
VHYLAYMYFNSNWLTPSPFPPFSTLPMVILTGLNILYPFFYRKCINIFTFLTYLFYLPSLVCDLPLAWPVSQQSILEFFWDYCKLNCFPMFFFSLFVDHIEMLLIFGNRYCILLLCWRCLWCLRVFLVISGSLCIRSCHLRIWIVWLLPFLFELLLFPLLVLLL